MKHESITSLPPSPADGRRHRMLEYTLMMSIRVLCLVSLIWVRGWWLVIPAAGAIFLPYFAVVVANVAQGRAVGPERPGGIVPVRPRAGARPVDESSRDGGERGPSLVRRGGRGAAMTLLDALGGAPDVPVCSRAGCRSPANWRIDWRNPRIHAEDRRKSWLACDEHVDFLRGFLASRDFPLEVGPLESGSGGGR